MAGKEFLDFGLARQSHLSARGSRLNVVYFALAAMNFMALAAAIWVTYHTLEILGERVEEAHAWRDRSAAIQTLAQTARAVFEPADSIFSTGDLGRERHNLEASALAFEKAYAGINEVLHEHGHDQVADIEARAAAIARIVRDVLHRTRAELKHFEEGRFENATRIMAAVDALQDKQQIILDELTAEAIEDFVVDLLEAGEETEVIRQSLSIFVAVSVILIIGALAYGANVQRVMRENAAQRERHLAALAEQERELKLNLELTRQAKDEAQLAGQRLEDAVHSLSDGFAIFDQNDRLIAWNNKYKLFYPALFGTLKKDMPITRIMELNITNAQEGDDWGKPDARALRLARRARPGEPFVMNAAGRKLEVREFRTKEGGWVETSRDVTDALLQQEEMQRAKREAEKASAAKSAFLANMSHEIRTPLNGVIGVMDMMLETGLTSEQRRHVEIARASGDQLLQVIGNVLDMSKLEAGALVLESVPFDIVSVAEQASQTFAARAAGKGLHLLVDIALEAEGHYRGDPTRLGQILMNLMSNAIKFTETGSIALRVRTDAADGAVRTLTFEVSDTGIGMDAQAQARLFQKFSQADDSITRRFGGTGLGLAICAELLTAMGSKIDVTSEPGKGSTFRFTLALEHLPAHAPATQISLTELKILVIDDLALNREILVRRLVQWGAEVHSASEGIEGVCLARAEHQKGRPFDLVMTDMHLPDLDGIGVAQGLHEAFGASRPKIILRSSMTRTPAEPGLMRGLFDAVTFKPVQQPVLAGAIREIFATGGNAAASGEAPAAPMSGAQILLVEDNETNRYVATQMLARMGCTVTTAENGAEAVRMAQDQVFDVILMDLQMPVMDGLSATRTIRKGGGINSATPILALTANAFVEDGERCREAGMNEHLTKPLRKQVLLTALRRWIDKTKTSVESTPIVIEHQIGAGILDASAWDALKEDLPSAAVDKLARTFLESQAAEIATYEDHVAQGDRADLKRKAHSLKGASRLIGANQLGNLAAKLEELAPQAAPDTLNALIAEIAVDFAKVTAALREKLRSAA